jgi:D-alanyl-D-alanine carboxypeptidase
MVRRQQQISTWIAGLALVCALVLGLAVGWAQFQIIQRGGWVAHDWSLTAATPGEVQTQLQAGLNDETAKNATIAGQLLHVMVPALKIDRTFGAGEDVSISDDVRVASNIKTFVSAAALKLVENGQLKLDAPIEPYLTDPVRQILQKSGRPIDQITLRHLLNHSSGIADYGSSQLFQLLAYVPTAFGLAWHWTPRDQIWFGANLTQKSPVGARFDYSDTNYLIASDMIAKATVTANAGRALRQILDWPAIGAKDTFWENYEPTPPGTRLVRHFRGAIEDTHLDVSFDQYGGGGLVMSVSDLAHAHRAVVRGDVFKNRVATRTTMQASGTAAGSNGYGMGIAAMVIEGETCWSHGGRWGTMAIHCPRFDLTVARSWGQSNGGPDPSDPAGPIAGLIKLAQQGQP